MNHLNPWTIPIGKSEYHMGFEIKFMWFINRKLQLGYGWECEIDGLNYGDWININHELLHTNPLNWFTLFYGGASTVEVSGLRGLLLQQAIDSIDAIIKLRSN